MKKFAALFAVLLALLPESTKVSADQPPQYFVNEASLPFAALTGTTTTRLWGVHGGAGYRIEVPENWNGELVVYAHGFRGIGLELTVSFPAIRAYLVANGYAWAASSYSKNGYDVKEGVKDTLALTMLFNGLVGNPTRRYLIAIRWAATSPASRPSSTRMSTTVPVRCAASWATRSCSTTFSTSTWSRRP